MAENRNKIESSTPVLSARIVRWVVAALGLTGAYLIPFPDYVGLRAIVALVLVGFAVYKEYESAKQNKTRDARSLETEAVARKASQDVEEVQRGRRLSGEQRDAIAGRLSTENLSLVKLIISYIPTATGAQDFAESIAEFLSNQLHISCDPVPVNPHAGPQPPQRVNNTVFIIASTACGSARALADAFALEVPEVERSGENPAWPFQTSIFQMRIIVGFQR